MSRQSLSRRLLVRLYAFSWGDAIGGGVVLLLGGGALVVLFDPEQFAGYVGSFLFGLGLFSILIGVLWGAVALAIGRGRP